jgi:hypothetical protein
MAGEKNVKGVVILDLVKVIKAFKDIPWEDYLESEDMEIVKSMVIPTAWYSAESFQRMALAVWEHVSKKDENVVREWARGAMKGLLEGPYRPHLERGDPFAATEKFLDLRRGLFSFSRTWLEKKGEKEMVVGISEVGKMEGFYLLTILVAAHVQVIIEFNGGKDVEFEIEERGDLKWT